MSFFVKHGKLVAFKRNPEIAHSDDESGGSNKSLAPINNTQNLIDLEPDADDFSGGKYVSFNAADEAKYRYRKGDPLARKPWLLCGLHKEVDKWGVGENAKKIVERIFKEDGKPLPSVDDLNAQVPMSEWPENPFGPKHGPWVLNYVLTFANPLTGERVILSNSTAGQRSAFCDLKDRLKTMTLMRGAGLALIELDTTSMPSNYGIKTIPFFRIYDWRPTGDPTPAIAPPAPTNPLSDELAAVAAPARDADDIQSPPRTSRRTASKPKEAAVDSWVSPWGDDKIPSLNP